MTKAILVLNAGSSSLKFALFEYEAASLQPSRMATYNSKGELVTELMTKYDVAGRKIEEVEKFPNDLVKTTYCYNKQGKLIEKTKYWGFNAELKKEELEKVEYDYSEDNVLKEMRRFRFTQEKSPNAKLRSIEMNTYEHTFYPEK